MQKLNINQIIKKIESEENFEAVSDDYSFTLKIEKIRSIYLWRCS